MTKRSSSSLFSMIASCFSGNVLEWYEFAIFGYLTPYISQLFFPVDHPTTALLLTYGIFATGFFMRPLGAFIVGYIGDHYGRKTSLTFSILMMTVPTVSIGLLPTYSQIGLGAPVFILICRLLQGLSLGGEFSSSIIYLIEKAPPHKRAFFGSWADTGSATGMILATLTSLILTTFLSKNEILVWGWRLPFLMGIFIGLIGIIMRRRLTETTEFLNAQSEPRPPFYREVLAHPLKFLLSVTFLAINAGGYYILIIYLPQQAPAGMTFYLPLVSLLINLVTNVAAAIIADKIGVTKTLLFGIAGAFLTIFPAVYATFYAPLPLIFLCHGLFSFSLGFCYGPRSRFVVYLYSVPVRCQGVGISYNLANALFGGTAPLMALYSVQVIGSTLAPAFLVAGMALISFLSVITLHHYYLSPITGKKDYF